MNTISAIAADSSICRSIYHSDNLPGSLSETVGIQTFEATHSLSQMMRDNHRDYSQYVAKQYFADLKAQGESTDFLSRLLAYKGPVPGDNHIGQRIVGPNANNNRLEYFNWDLKEGSLNSPYFYSIANLAMNTHAKVKKFDAKIKDVSSAILDSYLLGLQKAHMPKPEIIQQAEQVSIEQYQQQLSDDLSKFIKRKLRSFKDKPDKLAKFHDKDPDLGISRQQIHDAVQYYAKQTGEPIEMLDIAIRLKDRGSAHLKRIWVMIERKNRAEGDPQKFDVIEFKESLPSTMEKMYPTQLSHEQTYTQLSKIFGTTNKDMLQLIRINGHLMEMRLRKVELMNIPEDIPAIDGMSSFIELARYAAYDQGLRQSIYASPEQTFSWISFLTLHREAVIAEMRRLTKTYYARIKQQYHEQQQALQSQQPAPGSDIENVESEK